MPESPAPVLSSCSPSPKSRTPTPPASGQSMINQQLPPACGAKQLSKLKRFLTTLQQFGSDISPEIGERVRSLVLALVNSHLSIEEFHNKLQEATNFPLRPFVIPFLKANLPLLQRELSHCASLAKQSPQQYFARNQNVLLSEQQQQQQQQQQQEDKQQQQYLSHQNDYMINENGKRTSPEKNMGKDETPASKRHCSDSSPPSLNLPLGPIRLEDISLSRELREREMSQMRERFERERRMGTFTALYANTRHDAFDDEFKHVEHMLHCVVDMVDKTKRALITLQERVNRDRDDIVSYLRRGDIDCGKKIDNRYTDERLIDVKKRAEEAVTEVKRQAVIELQKAVTAAENKASEMIHSERLKMERILSENRKQATQDALLLLNQQEESNESCSNCGRRASETCSGCNVARYCGSFCQHKDWELHHRVCSQLNLSRYGINSSGIDAITTATSTSTINSSPPSSTTTMSSTNEKRQNHKHLKKTSRSNSPIIISPNTTSTNGQSTFTMPIATVISTNAD